jgi:feruloyl-CoA synthase
MIGVPTPELVEKLIPLGGDRYELRVAGPNVIDGYYEDPERTAASFDDEGFFITGDAVRLVDPADHNRGVFFDGRLTEDFKLVTGTFVRAGVLRMHILPELAGLVQDVVVVGEGRGQVGLLVFPAPGRAAGLTDDGRGALAGPDYTAAIQAVLGRLAAHATGSSMRVARAIVCAEPPSVGEHEITPKGSINTKIVARRRAALIERLYDDADPAVIRV